MTISGCLMVTLSTDILCGLCLSFSNICTLSFSCLIVLASPSTVVTDSSVDNVHVQYLPDFDRHLAFSFSSIAASG